MGMASLPCLPRACRAAPYWRTPMEYPSGGRRFLRRPQVISRLCTLVHQRASRQDSTGQDPSATGLPGGHPAAVKMPHALPPIGALTRAQPSNQLHWALSGSAR